MEVRGDAESFGTGGCGGHVVPADVQIDPQCAHDLRLVGGALVQAWARDDDGLREALEQVVAEKS